MGWVSFYNQVITVGGSAASGAIPFTVDGLTGERLIFEANNPFAPATWKSAFTLIFSQQLVNFPGGSTTSEYYGGKVRLNSKTLVSPPFFGTAPYQVKLLIPYWHQQLHIRIWQEPNLNALTAKAETDKISFNYGDASPKPITQLIAGKTVLTAQVVISIPFNGVGAALSLGDADVKDRLMSTSQIDPSFIAEYETNPGYMYSATTQILLTITPGEGCTQGAGHLLLEAV